MPECSKIINFMPIVIPTKHKTITMVASVTKIILYIIIYLLNVKLFIFQKFLKRDKYQYFYIDIPIKVNFNLLTKRAKLYITAGISPNIFIIQKTNSLLQYDDGHTKKETQTAQDFSIINLTVIGGIGFSYDITEHLYIKIEPTYRRSVTSIIDAPIKGYLYSVGLNTGFYYKL